MSGTLMARSAGHHLRRMSTEAHGVAVATSVVPIATVVLAQVLLFPMPVGGWVQGVVLGLLGSLMAGWASSTA